MEDLNVERMENGMIYVYLLIVTQVIFLIKRKKKCIKDICSSIPIDEEDEAEEEEEEEEEEKEKEEEKEETPYWKKIYFKIIITFLVIFILLLMFIRYLISFI